MATQIVVFPKARKGFLMLPEAARGGVDQV